jgi:hypothetical protein
MERELFRDIKSRIDRAGFYRKRPGQSHSDGAILAVYFWSVLNDRPVVWACDKAHWPPGLWRGVLPSQSCMSRRLASERFKRQVLAIERAASPAPREVVLLSALDGKPIPVAWHSTDHDARVGRGAGCLARGYKLHAMIDCAGTLLAWRVTGLNVDERAVALELLREVRGVCYVVADANYNSNRLFEMASMRGAQLIAPRKASHQSKGIGRRRHHQDRLRSIDLLEDGPGPFALDLLNTRRAIERFFANLTNFGGGLTHLPPWVRTHPRVLAYTAAKLTLFHLKNNRLARERAA